VPLFAAKFYISKEWQTKEVVGSCFERIIISTRFIYSESNIEYNSDLLVTVKVTFMDPISYFCTENLQVSNSYQDNYDIFFMGGKSTQYSIKTNFILYLSKKLLLMLKFFFILGEHVFEKAYNDPIDIIDIHKEGLKFFIYCQGPLQVI
jgi:hypothetical protein